MAFARESYLSHTLVLDTKTLRRVCVVLTGNFERGVSGARRSRLVAGHAPVDAAVLLPLAVHHPQEEERAAGQQHAVRLGVERRRPHQLALVASKPLDRRLGTTLGLAVQRHRLVFGHCDVRGVLGDSRRPQLT